ncbi:gliding motility lipoprotein GldD [Maribacter sp. 2-571]|uniref:gliding motility lipoprotein GldD n=1 Tax=Maribacter sp. 2-571 TaxID=3417569 RepID=UPI003D3442B4
MMCNKFLMLFVVLFLMACGEETLPKPNAVLRLEYPKAQWDTLSVGHFQFQKNRLAKVKDRTSESLTLDYPAMKGTIYLNYKKVDANLEKLLVDAQKFSYEHAVKADAIDTKVFQNEEERVYGQFFSVSGDAASQAQFYATDSTDHFVTGSLYFYARPNYDSIYPAAVYLQNDILTIMESLRWKE